MRPQHKDKEVVRVRGYRYLKLEGRRAVTIKSDPACQVAWQVGGVVPPSDLGGSGERERAGGGISCPALAELSVAGSLQD
eukprot:scaffold111108_cov32-Tisochrysis_lutea.AAC.4